MPRNLLVRPTEEGDLPAITSIYAEAVSAGIGSFELKAPDIVEMTRRWRKRADKGFPHLVAVEDGVVVGYAYISRHRTSAAYRFLAENSIFVASGAQGVGVGQALLTELIERSEKLDFRQMIALIGDMNSASVKLHERLGFRKVGVIEGSAFKHGRWIDTLFMQRALGAGTGSSPSDVR